LIEFHLHSFVINCISYWSYSSSVFFWCDLDSHFTSWILLDRWIKKEWLTLSEHKVSVEPSHDYVGNTCDHKAECAMFGLDMIANHEANTSQQEVEVDEWNQLEFVLRYQVVGLLVLLLSIQRVAWTRLWTRAINPLAGYDYLVEKSTRILTNTLEQFLVSFVNQLILATWVSEDKLKFIPLINFYFLLGRICFMIGYHIDPKHRTFGFVVAGIPNVIMTGFNTYFLLTKSQSFLLDPPVKQYSGGKMWVQITSTGDMEE